MRKFFFCLVLILANTIPQSQIASATEIQNWLYVTGNSPKETRTSVTQGNASGFGVTSLQGIGIGNQVALSDGSVHLLDTLGRVWGWGSDGREVGVGSAAVVSQPRVIPIAERVIQISSGNNHTLALTETGKVFAWGWSYHGQIGLGEPADYNASWQYSSPVQVNIPGGRTINWISAGGYQSFAIANDNSIWGWGINENYSILGTGGYSSVFTPTFMRVPGGFIPIKLVTDGGRYTLVLSKGGGVIGWGSNGNNGNGLGTSGQINSPTLIFPEGASIVDIAVNGAATYVLKSDGTVFSAGYNVFGQLGSLFHPGGNAFARVALPTTFRAERIFAANSNAWAVGSNGQTYAWGAGSNDTLGTGYTGVVFTPVLVSTINDYGIVSIAGNYTQTFAIVSNQAKVKAAADKAAADKAAKEEADSKAAAEKLIAEAKAQAEKIISDAKAAAASAAKKKTRIICVKGKLKKKVTAVKPKCPTGYKRK